MIEGSGSGSGSRSGSILLTNGSGSGSRRPKNMWIRIRIHKTAFYGDGLNRWPEAVPLSSTAAADCAQTLLTGWIQRFGVPATITSDRGPQFIGSVWSALCRLLNTTAYHPQANGLIERFHRWLKDVLRACAARADWASHLAWVMLGQPEVMKHLSPQLIPYLSEFRSHFRLYIVLSVWKKF